MMLKPILVLGSGRTGSTALMSLLGGSPRVAFDKRYPYEAAYLSYFAQIAAVMRRSNEADVEGWSRASLVAGASSIVGPMPFQTDGYFDRDRLARSSLAGMWKGFSDSMVARALGAGCDAPTHFAEKAGYFTAELSADELGALQIFLLRDPRDVMMSSKAFNARRGTLRFGWRRDETDISYARRIAKRFRKNLDAAIAVADSELDRMVLRYEDLALDPDGSARRLSDFLGVELRVADHLPFPESHATSDDPAASVGRWRDEMDDKVKSIFDKRLGDVLVKAGYELAGVRRPGGRGRRRADDGASDGT